MFLVRKRGLGHKLLIHYVHKYLRCAPRSFSEVGTPTRRQALVSLVLYTGSVFRVLSCCYKTINSKSLFFHFCFVRKRGLEPPHLTAHPPQGCVYTNFTTCATIIDYKIFRLLANKIPAVRGFCYFVSSTFSSVVSTSVSVSLISSFISSVECPICIILNLLETSFKAFSLT
jgi:hypothetical protein